MQRLGREISLSTSQDAGTDTAEICGPLLTQATSVRLHLDNYALTTTTTTAHAVVYRS